MKDLLAKSSNELLRSMTEEVMSEKTASLSGATAKGLAKIKRPNSAPTAASTSTRSRLKEDSISKQFTGSLKLLYEALDSAQPHFVRCIKPNNKKLSSRFNSDKVWLSSLA